MLGYTILPKTGNVTELDDNFGCACNIMIPAKKNRKRIVTFFIAINFKIIFI